MLGKLNEKASDDDTVALSQLITVRKENLFVLPSVFKINSINKPTQTLFEYNVNKLTPTTNFAKKCSDLRKEIMTQLKDVAYTERAPWTSLQDWINMSGTIWDTIITYQDIVQYKSLREFICSQKAFKQGWNNNGNFPWKPQ